MTLSLKSVNVINLFAEDLVGTKSFYQEVFGLPLIFEDEKSALFKFENMMLMVRDAAVPELIAPEAVGSPEGGSRVRLGCVCR
jgi:lactoylglutathione lyase